MLAAKGRVVVTGMGKSGHIARKVAATLASTGTPAFFLHPAEASHGDLGMIGAGDVVLAFSRSGETPELRDVIHYCKRFDVQADRGGVGARQRAGQGRQPRLRAAGGRGGLPEPARAHHLDHHAAGASATRSPWRCWRRAASRPATSTPSIRAASWARSC